MTATTAVDIRWIRNVSDERAVALGCYFDPEAGQCVIDFIERYCKQSKGRWAGQPLLLLDWQKDAIYRLFGWKSPDGLRRFRRFYCEVPKKNGKSTLISALTIVFELLDGEGAPEIYLNACDRQQASIIFDEASRMVQSSPELAKRLTIVDSKKRIVWKAGNGVIIANSADAPNKDGLNPSVTIFDELHRQPNRDLWDVFEYAAAAREQPLTISITTAGESEDGVWFEQRTHSEMVNDGRRDDVTHLGIVYRADPKDDLDDPATWHKANPSLGHTIREEDFRRELAEAKEVPEKWANFLRLRLNIVARAEGKFLGPDDWNACDEPHAQVELDQLKGLPCYGGVDLASVDDLTALALIFKVDDLWYSWVRCYMPSGSVLAAMRRDKAPYDAWIREGWVVETEGDVCDYEYIRRDLNAIAADHDLRAVFIDPALAAQFALGLQADGIPTTFLRQGFLSLGPPTKELRRWVLGRMLRHGGNPVLRWCVLNAVAVTDAMLNIKLDKKKSRQKIDAAAALVNAVAAATAADEGEGDSPYNERGVEWL